VAAIRKNTAIMGHANSVAKPVHQVLANNIIKIVDATLLDREIALPMQKNGHLE
jgi:hypothetical protein